MSAQTTRGSVLAVIPARGGSKSIPLKNIYPLCGRPLLVYTIEAARASRYIRRCIVSTDHPEIAKVAADHGAEVVLRPPELATDAAPTEWALIHAIETLDEKGFKVDFVVTLEPTSPLRTTRLIDLCIGKAIEEPDADCVMTVKETRKCYGRLVKGRFEYLLQNQPRRRQDREPLYEESSTVYVTRTSSLFHYKSVIGKQIYAVIVEDPEEIVDINEPLDIVIAEAIMNKRKQAVRHD